MVTPRSFRAACLGTLLAAATLGAVPATAHAPRHHDRVTAHAARGRDRAHQSRACANANAPVASTGWPLLRAAVVCLINQQRTERGLRGLRESAALDRSSQGWTNELVATQSFTHGTAFWTRISAAGFSWSSVGENIATGFATPARVVGGWMHSTGHCQNILSPTYKYVGTGVNRRAIKRYGTGNGTWTQDFALPLAAQAPSTNFGPARGCPYA